MAWLGAVLSLPAAIITWTNPSGGDWNTANNWTPNQLPGTADTAILAMNVAVTVDAPVTVSNVTFSSGTLVGSGTLTVNGTMTWTGGTMSGAGVTAIASGGNLTISGTDAKFFRQRTINNAGTITWSGGDINSGDGATINNQAGGVMEVQSDQNWGLNQGGNLPVLNNAGTFRKTTATDTTTLGITFNNEGTVSV